VSEENQYGENEEKTFSLNSPSGYELSNTPESVVINPHEGEILEQESDEMAAIRFAANLMGINEINDPNPQCKKCGGRGYTGKLVNNGQPIPCDCIFPDEVRKQMRENTGVPLSSMNRKMRRQMEKQMRKQRKRH
jgi:hypothetical protein